MLGQALGWGATKVPLCPSPHQRHHAVCCRDSHFPSFILVLLCLVLLIIVIDD